MIIGILGDIHGNIDALHAMLRSMKTFGADTIFCTGDIVGYGAAPAECIDCIRENDIACIMGNHDCYTAFPENLTSNVRPEAVEVFEWNREILSDDHLRWLQRLPHVLQLDTFQLCHGSAAPFPRWEYVSSPGRVIQHFLYQEKPLCFNGHTHVPLFAAHTPGQRVRFQRLQNIFLPKTPFVLISVGAVGQPRDGDPRACAVLYDTDRAFIRLLRVNYDIGRAQKRIFDAGLPPSLAYRLAVGQ